MSETVSAGGLTRTGLAAAGLALAGALLFHGPGIATGSELFFTHDLSASDLWHLNYPARHFYQQELRAGRLPLWCPTIGTGFPLHAEGQVGALYPPNLLLHSALPLPLAFNWGILLHAMLGAALAAALAHQLGAGRGGGLLAGVVFAFSGFMIAHLKHVNMVAAATWAPLLLLLLERAAQRARATNLAPFGAAVGLMILAGHPQIAYYNLFACALYGAALVARIARGPEGWRKEAVFAGATAWAAALGLLLAAAQLLPTLELNGRGPRREALSFARATEYGYRPSYLITFLRPMAFGDPGRLVPVERTDAESGRKVVEAVGFATEPGSKTLFWEITGYVGLLPLALALAGAVLGFRRRAGPLLALLVAATLLMLGRHGGLAWLAHQIVPGFALFRFHERFLLHVDLALAVLAGIGLARLAGALAARRTGLSAGVTALVVLAAFIDLRGAMGDHNPRIDANRWSRPPATAERMALEETGRTPPSRMIDFDPNRLVFTNAYRRAGGWKGDLAPYDPAQAMLYPNLNVLYDRPGFGFYYQIYPEELAQANRAALVTDPASGRTIGVRPQTAGLFNVRYAVSPMPELPGWEELASFDGDSVHGHDLAFRLHLYRNPQALPRAWLVPRAVGLRGDAAGPDGIPPARWAVIRGVMTTSFDPRREILIPLEATDADLATTAEGEPIATPVEFVEASPQRVTIDVDSPRDAWLYLADIWYPGWVAEVDGREVPILPANVAGRAVPVPRGRHRVVFDYRPTSFRLGAALSLVGLLGLATLPFQRRRLVRSPGP